MPEFDANARDIQNQASHRVRTATMETRLFREFFGISMRVLEILWELLDRDSLPPKGGRRTHLLWALHLMKVYPKQGPGCVAAGLSAGAVNPKNHKKWVWEFIKDVSELVNVVVSNHTVRMAQSVTNFENAER